MGSPDKRTQRLLPQWKEEVVQRIQWRRPRPAPQPPQYADPLAATDKTVYTFCGVRFPGWQRVYYYRTDDETLSVGDQVLVPGKDGPTEAESYPLRSIEGYGSVSRGSGEICGGEGKWFFIKLKWVDAVSKNF